MASQKTSASKPLAEWQSIIDKDICTLNQFMLMRTRKDDEDSRNKMAPWFKDVSENISDIEQIASNLTRYVAAEEAKLLQLTRLEKEIAHQTERYALIKAQMPAEVLDCLELSAKTDVGKDDDNEKKPRLVNEHGTQAVSKLLPKPAPATPKAKISRKQSRVGTRKNNAPASESTKAPSPIANVPVINSVSQEELDSAPQYVKGRLTVEKIEGVVNSLNAIAASKYTLLNKPYRELNSSEITTWQDLRENECSETSGKNFLTDNEIKGFGKFRLDATAKSVINVLRHVGALKEVRGKNKSRIFIIN